VNLLANNRGDDIVKLCVRHGRYCLMIAIKRDRMVWSGARSQLNDIISGLHISLNEHYWYFFTLGLNDTSHIIISFNAIIKDNLVESFSFTKICLNM